MLPIDIHKKERTGVRQQFTKFKNRIYERIEEAHAIDDDGRTDVDLAQRKIDRLLELDRLILDILLEEDVPETGLQEEMDSSDKYQSQWLELSNKVAKLGKGESPFASISDIQLSKVCGSRSGGCDYESGKKRNFNLPKLNLTQFDGDVRNWIPFWGQFQKIDMDDNIDEHDKFQYLISAIPKGTEARDLIDSFPPSAQNYRKAIDHLKQRYAREELLIEVYIRELLTLIISQVRGQYQLSLTSLYDKLTTQLRALESMGLTSDKYAAMLFPMVESALPAEILKAWERYHNNFTNTNEKGNQLDNILNFLKHEVESNQRILLARNGFLDFATTPPATSPAVPTASCLIAGDENRAIRTRTGMKCIWCNGFNHSPLQCFKVLEFSLDERKEHLKKNKGCFNCLRAGHATAQCRLTVKCVACLKRHNVLLCPDTKKADTQNSSANTDLSLSHRNSVTLLQTLLVKVSYMDKQLIIRALIDSGAQRSYIKSGIAKQLGLPSVRTEMMNHVVFGGTETKLETHQVYNIVVKNLDSTFDFCMTVLDEDKICGNIPRIHESQLIADLKKNNITLTDVGHDVPEVGILIGADYCGILLTSNIIQLPSGLTALQTKLGWTIQGMTFSANPSIISNSLHVAELWDLEALGIRDPAVTKEREEEENEVLAKFKDSITINEEERFEVNLPLKEEFSELKNNRELAEKRLISNTKRLIDGNNYEVYDKVFKDWLHLGIIEEVQNDDNSGHYLAHHAVIKDSSTTTKVRPVFDASARDKAGNSLNSCLYTGMNFLDLIPKLLMQFRMGAVGITADIEKAFLQISLSPSNRDLLKFLWWKDSDRKEVMTYRHRRVVFGLTCSPFLLNATIAHHLTNAPSKFRDTAHKLLDSFYVDNCIISLDEDRVDNFVKEARDLMNIRKFNLREWVVSPKKDHQPEKDVVSVLGILWHTKEDTLSCKIDIPIAVTKRLTRRTLLSVAQRIFDPIGFTSPTSLLPKILLQETWLIAGGWDDELPQHIQDKFIPWLEKINILGTCHLPRRLNLNKIEGNKLSLHVFSDASKQAYAACIFLRAEYCDTVKVQLVLAKARVAPSKQKITVPRLELLATLIATRLSRQVLEALKIKCPIYYWTDSSVALTWIKKEAHWATFVKNRVKEIREYSSREEWHYVPGHANPADLPSRGCDAEMLAKSRWWLGPDWLKSDKTKWPMKSLSFDSEADIELRKSAVCVPAAVGEREFSDELLYFSKYSKILRMFTWVVRFTRNIRLNRKDTIKDKELRTKEVEDARKILFKLIQNGMNISSNIATFKDEDGLIRVRTKLLLCEGSDDFKTPIMLPGQHEIVKRLVQQKHEQLYHAGVATLITILREEYWIIGVRKLSKGIVASCVKCRRHKAKPCTVPFAPLPLKRVDNSATAFETSGIDYAGPLILRSGEKAYVVLFTCAVYRAIHLELTKSLSTESFLMAFRRFIARRGRINTIYTDNGSNFVGANNLLGNINWSTIETDATVREIKWIFNPPTAAWWGGWWERLVRSVKDLLKRTLGKACLNYIELQTVLCDCEAIVNARPLTYVTESDVLAPITPNHFLLNVSLNDVPDLDVVDRDHLNSRLRYIQHIRDGLRQRFKSEYLSLLVHRGKECNHNLQVGDVVLIESESKRINWPLGLILQLYKGTDGHTRVARLKTANGERVRPLQRLYTLEVSQWEADVALQHQDKGKKTRSGRIVKVPCRLQY